MNKGILLVLLGIMQTPCHGESVYKSSDEILQRIMPDASRAEAADVDRVIGEVAQFVIEAHPQVKAASARTRGSEADLDAARDTFQPTLSASGDASRARSRDLDGGDPSTSRQASVALSLRQNLFRGGTDFRKYKIAEWNLESQRADAESRRLNVTYAASHAALLYNQAAMKVLLAEAASADAHDIRRLSEKKLAVGLVGTIDAHQSISQELQAATQEQSARNQLDQAEIALARALLAPAPAETWNAWLQRLGRVSAGLPGGSDDLGARAQSLQERIAEATYQANDLAVVNARSNRYAPSLDFVASYRRGWASPSVTSLARDDDATSRTEQVSYGLELSWNLWAPTLGDAIQAAAEKKEESRLQLDVAERTHNIIGQGLLKHLHGLKKSLPILRQSSEQARQLYLDRKSLYDAGAADVFEVIDANSKRISSIAEWYNAVCDLQITAQKLAYFRQGYVVED